MTVYVDMLFLSNFFFDFIVIRIAVFALRIKFGFGRACGAAAFGGLYGAIAFFFELPAAAAASLHLAALAIICLIAYGKMRAVMFGKFYFVTLAVFALFGGIQYAIYNFAGYGNAFKIAGGVVYYDLPGIVFYTVAALGAALAAVAAALKRRFSSGLFSPAECMVYCGDIRREGKGLVDTGSKFRDCVTGKPVVVCAKGVFDFSEIEQKFPQRMRLLPVNTVSDSGLLCAFRCDRMVFCFDGDEFSCDGCLIAEANADFGEYDFIIPATMSEKREKSVVSKKPFIEN